MTNQPKDNEWIEKLASYMHDVRANRFLHQKYNCSDDNMDRREKQARTKYSKLSEEDKEKDRKFAREILDNLPKPTEVVAPVEPINQERLSAIKKKYKKRLTTDSIDVNYAIYKQVYNEFLDDITSIQSDSEVLQ
jgi:hypothetical protein